MVRPRRASSIRQTTLVSHGRVQDRVQDLLVLVRLLRSLRLSHWGEHRGAWAPVSIDQKIKKIIGFIMCLALFSIFFDLGPILAHLGSTWPPRRLQDAPKTAQDASKSPEDASKSLQDASKSLQDASSKMPPRASKMRPRASKTPPREAKVFL